MKLINLTSSGDALKNYKAPKGLQYLVTSVLFFTTNINVPTLFAMGVWDYNREATTTDLRRDFGDALAGYGWELDAGNNVSTINPQPFQVLDINHKSKYLSIQVEVSATEISYNIIIYGELVSISRTESIIEWFRKGR